VSKRKRERREHSRTVRREYREARDVVVLQAMTVLGMPTDGDQWRADRLIEILPKMKETGGYVGIIDRSDYTIVQVTVSGGETFTSSFLGSDFVEGELEKIRAAVKSTWGGDETVGFWDAYDVDSGRPGCASDHAQTRAEFMGEVAAFYGDEAAYGTLKRTPRFTIIPISEAEIARRRQSGKWGPPVLQ